MAIYDLFSKRQKRARGEVPDVYVYDNLPQPLRRQIVHIVRDTFSNFYRSDPDNEAYRFVNKTLLKEYGSFELIKNATYDQKAIFDCNCSPRAGSYAAVGSGVPWSVSLMAGRIPIPRRRAVSRTDLTLA